jgi:hypothetical protein
MSLNLSQTLTGQTHPKPISTARYRNHPPSVRFLTHLEALEDRLLLLMESAKVMPQLAFRTGWQIHRSPPGRIRVVKPFQADPRYLPLVTEAVAIFLEFRDLRVRSYR